MVDKKGSRVIDTWKQKKWYKIVSPQFFGSNPLGETVASEDSQLIGRTVKVSLASVTGDVKKQNTSAIFEITGMKDGNAQTILKKMEISPSSIRRMIRKGKNRIDVSMVCATKDNVVLRIKPFLVTRALVGNSILTSMRKLLDSLLRVEADKATYESFTRDIISGRLQKKIKQYLNKIYPLRTVEIRSVEQIVFTGQLPPVPKLPEIKEETVEETEEEKIEKRVKARKLEEKPAEEKKKITKKVKSEETSEPKEV